MKYSKIWKYRNSSSQIRNSKKMNLTESERLDKWNHELVNSLIPDTIVLAVYTFLGLCGNGIVIIVYKRRFSGKNVDRYFVPYLAISDLLASVICGSSGIVYNRYPAIFYFDDLCKTFWFFSALITYFSILLLLVIAVQRYRKIVQPLQRQMDMKSNRIALICAFITSLVVASPTPVLYGVVPFANAKDDISGQRCSKIKDRNKAFSIFYGILIGLIVLAVVGSLIGIYTRIGWTIFKHVRQQRKFSNISDIGSTSKISSVANLTEINDIRSGETANVEDNSDKNITEGRQIFTISQHVDDKEKKLVSSHHVQVNQRIMNRFTLMFMLITVIFLICYIPKVCLMLLEAKNPKYWDNLNDRDRAGMTFIYRMFIINDVANPFVYAFLDTKFRKELKFVFCREAMK